MPCQKLPKFNAWFYVIYKKRVSIAVLSGLLVEMLNKVAPLIIIHFAQKRLGIEKFGFALFGISVIELVTPFIVFGYNQFGILAAGKNQVSMDRLIGNMWFLKCFHFLLLLVFLFMFFFFVPAYRSYFSLIAAVSFVLAFGVIESIWVQTASQRVFVTNIIVGLCRFAGVILILLFVRDPDDAILFAILSLLPPALVNLLSAIYSLHRFGIRMPERDQWKLMFRNARPFSLIVLFAICLERMDIFIAEHFGGLVWAGLYAGCSRLAHSLQQIANTINTAFFSEMIAVDDRNSLSTHMKVSIWSLLFFLSPIIFGVWFVDEEILTLIFGDHFRPVAKLLGWLFLSASLSLVIVSFGEQVLLVNQQTRKYSKALFLGLVSGLSLSYLGGKSGNLLYIAWGMCGGKLIATLLIARESKKYLTDFPWGAIIKALSPGMLMAFFLKLLKLDGLVPNLSVGAAIFLLAGYFFNRQEFLNVFRIYRHMMSKETTP
ncbi:MAG: hypothetical protein HYW48_11425 [Deltaproteobacteria bacterium]|nr:hypothetical protein [Deltaproteobacteria bacterium]